MKQGLLPVSKAGRIACILGLITLVLSCLDIILLISLFMLFPIALCSDGLTLAMAILTIKYARSAIRKSQDSSILVKAALIIGVILAVFAVLLIAFMLLIVFFFMTHPIDLGPF